MILFISSSFVPFFRPDYGTENRSTITVNSLILLLPIWISNKDGSNEASNRNIGATVHSFCLKQSLCQSPDAQHHVTHHSDFWEQFTKKVSAELPLTTM